MRKAIHTQLNTITDFGSRGYSPQMAPDNTTTPYYVVKIYGDDEVPGNKAASMNSYSVFIYDDAEDFDAIDVLEKTVREKLDGVTLTTDDSDSFVSDYIKTVQDNYDPDRDLIFHRVDFDVAGARPT